MSEADELKANGRVADARVVSLTANRRAQQLKALQEAWLERADGRRP